MSRHKVITADVMDGLRQLEDESVHCVVTSPPYWGLRDYQTASWEGGDPTCDHTQPLGDGAEKWNSSDTHERPFRTGTQYTGQKLPRLVCKCGARRIDRQIGLEPTPDAFVARMVEVFREVRRVLRKDGTLWLNMGDSYASTTSGTGARGGSFAAERAQWQGTATRQDIPPGLKPKDLIGMPWRVAFALQADGWWLRSDIIWAKPNPMPESVTDRPTKAHEYVFLLTKAERYYYDADAVRDEPTGRTDPIRHFGKGDHAKGHWTNYQLNGLVGRNKRSVWTIATAPFSEAHFATFPPDLPEICIKAGTSQHGCCTECGAPWERETTDTEEYAAFKACERERKGGGMRTNGLEQLGLTRGTSNKSVRASRTTLGWSPSCSCAAAVVPATVLDPFAGAGTTLLVADRLQRNAIGIELNPEYAAMAERRLSKDRGGLLDLMEQRL